MRLSLDLFLLGLLASAVAWFAHAPADPPARAVYLCAPVRAVGSALAQIGASLEDDGRIAPPTHPWQLDPGRSCARLVERIAWDGEP